MKAAFEIAVIKPSPPAETPFVVYIAAGSLAIGASLIALAIVRWFLAFMGSGLRETSSLIILLIGFALVAVGGHCLDLFEARDRST